MIVLDGFSKKYSSKDSEFAVEKVSFKAEKGITCLLGLNGAGKSTIIKAVAGEHFPTEGKVFVGDSQGKLFDTVTDAKKCASLTGYIPEIPDLPLNISASEYLYFCGKIHGLTGKELEKAFSRTVSQCEIKEILSKKIGSLSKGYRQRLLFARALIHNPENLIFDESVNGLDASQIIQFRKLLKKLSENKTVIISTHLMQEVHALCDNILIMSQGKIIASGTEQQILQVSGCKNIEEAFIYFSTRISK